MGQLDAHLGALRPHERRDLRKLACVLLLPDAEILRADPAFGRDRRRLGEYDRGAAHRAGPEVDEMPLARETVLRGVLTHRGNDDAVLEGDFAEGDGGEEHSGRIVAV